MKRVYNPGTFFMKSAVYIQEGVTFWLTNRLEEFYNRQIKENVFIYYFQIINIRLYLLLNSYGLEMFK